MPVSQRKLLEQNHKKPPRRAVSFYSASTVGGFGGIFSASHFI